MRLFIFCLFLFTLQSCQTEDIVQYKQCGTKELKRIVAGKSTEAYTQVVKLFYQKPNYKLICSGVVIGPKTILTARHCIKGDFFDIFSNDIKISTSKSIHKHPSIDLAIVFTEKDLNLQISELPEEKAKNYLKQDLITVGYGVDYMNPGGGRKYGTGTILGKDSSGLLVVGQTDTSVCYGDSGGPLMHCHTLIGIASQILETDQDKKCMSGKVYYVDVFENLDWIYSKMDQFDL